MGDADKNDMDANVTLPRSTARALLEATANAIRVEVVAVLKALQSPSGLPASTAAETAKSLARNALALEVGTVALGIDDAGYRDTLRRTRAVLARLEKAQADAIGVSNATLHWRPDPPAAPTGNLPN